MNVPMVEIFINKDQFNSMKKIFPAHELAIYTHTWGAECIDMIGRSDAKDHEMDSIEDEVKRLVESWGKDLLQSVFGRSYPEIIEVSINRIMEKERKLDGSENTAKSENGVSAETRV